MEKVYLSQLLKDVAIPMEDLVVSSVVVSFCVVVISTSCEGFPQMTTAHENAVLQKNKQKKYAHRRKNPRWAYCQLGILSFHPL